MRVMHQDVPTMVGPLRAGEATIASILERAWIRNRRLRQWGCGGRDSLEFPEAHGFDVFFGHGDQVHAHSFYPPYLIRNSEEVSSKETKADETERPIRIMRSQPGHLVHTEKQDRPFFNIVPITPAAWDGDIPETDPAWERYRNAAWMKEEGLSQDIKNYAAMVSMVDNDLGTVLNLLRTLKSEENTIVFFTGDNGGQDRFRSPEHPRGFFRPQREPAHWGGLSRGQGKPLRRRPPYPLSGAVARAH